MRAAGATLCLALVAGCGGSKHYNPATAKNDLNVAVLRALAASAAHRDQLSTTRDLVADVQKYRSTLDKRDLNAALDVVRLSLRLHHTCPSCRTLLLRAKLQ